MGRTMLASSPSTLPDLECLSPRVAAHRAHGLNAVVGHVTNAAAPHQVRTFLRCVKLRRKPPAEDDNAWPSAPLRPGRALPAHCG